MMFYILLLDAYFWRNNTSLPLPCNCFLVCSKLFGLSLLVQFVQGVLHLLEVTVDLPKSIYDPVPNFQFLPPRPQCRQLVSVCIYDCLQHPLVT